MTTAEKAKGGLEDVVATSSAICYLDGDRGVLAYCGHDIHDLAKSATFEEVCYLLWHRRLPTRAELGDLQSQLAAARMLPEPILRLMRSLPPVDGMDALRTLTSALGHYDSEVNDAAPAAQYRKAVRLTAQVGTLVATWGRLKAGGGVIDPDPVMGQAANFLYMLTGTRPNPTAIRAFDVALILHADHELNASTFAARVAVATLADLHAALTAAVATLKGPRHGGANEDVLAMLLEIGDPARAEAYVEGRIGGRDTLSKAERSDPKSRMPGFGHRVYRVDDARARVLRGMAKSMAAATGKERLFEVAERVYDAMRARTSLPVNVDFFSAVVYDALGIPPDFCTSIFAVGRTAGWIAHILEQFADNRLIRPRAHYIGPAPRPFASAVS